MHNRTKNLSDEQQSRFEAMVRLSDLLNLTMADDVIRTTGKYSEMLFTDFLEKLYDTIQNINDCKHQLYMDDFVRIARFSVPAIKHIVSNPSTHILKKSEKVHVSKMKQTTSTTMRWMAKNPAGQSQKKLRRKTKCLLKLHTFHQTRRKTAKPSISMVFYTMSYKKGFLTQNVALVPVLTNAVKMSKNFTI